MIKMIDDFERLRLLWIKVILFNIGKLKDVYKPFHYFNGWIDTTEWSEEWMLIFCDREEGSHRHYQFYIDRKLIIECDCDLY